MKPIKCSTGEIAKTYPDYLKTKHWLSLKKRFKGSNISSGKCYFCKNRRVQLHHITYDRVGDEELTDLIELCRKHHRDVHKKSRKINKKKYRAKIERKLFGLMQKQPIK